MSDTANNNGILIRDVLKDNPLRASFFVNLGFDLCTDGKLSIQQACEENGLNVDAVWDQLRAFDSTAQGHESPLVPPPEPFKNDDASSWTILSLIQNILDTHHPFVYSQLRTLAVSLAKVADTHGDIHPELHTLAESFSKLHDEITLQLDKEEDILFPIVEEGALTGSMTDATDKTKIMHRLEDFLAAHPGCGKHVAELKSRYESLKDVLADVQKEHEACGQRFAALRSTVGGSFSPPKDACDSYRKLFKDLDTLEKELKLQFHKENDILFPMIKKEMGQVAT